MTQVDNEDVRTRRRSRKSRSHNKYRHKVRPFTDMTAYEDRNITLVEMGFKDYDTYCRSHLWRDIRAKKLAKDPKCFSCFKEAYQVHHGKYDRETLEGLSDKDLYSVCGGCHHRCEITRSGYKRSVEGATQELKRMRRINLTFRHRPHRPRYVKVHTPNR